MKKLGIISCLIFLVGCQKSFDITEPSSNSTPKEAPKSIDYTKKYSEAIPAEKFNKDYLANRKDFKGKKVQIIGNISHHGVDETEDVDGKPEKRLYFVASDKTYPVACIVDEGFTNKDIGEQKKGRVFEGEILADYAGQIHLKPCKLLK